jgi:hypothetical protein
MDSFGIVWCVMQKTREFISERKLIGERKEDA